MTRPEQAVPYAVLLAVGGRQHGQEIRVAASAETWTDPGDETYYRRAEAFPYVQVDPANPRSVSRRKGYVADVLLHEDIAGDPEAARAWWTSLGLARLYAQYGQQVPVAQIVSRPPESPNGRAS